MVNRGAGCLSEPTILACNATAPSAPSAPSAVPQYQIPRLFPPPPPSLHGFNRWANIWTSSQNSLLPRHRRGAASSARGAISYGTAFPRNCGRTITITLTSGLDIMAIVKRFNCSPPRTGALWWRGRRTQYLLSRSQHGSPVLFDLLSSQIARKIVPVAIYTYT